ARGLDLSVHGAAEFARGLVRCLPGPVRLVRALAPGVRGDVPIARGAAVARGLTAPAPAAPADGHALAPAPVHVRAAAPVVKPASELPAWREGQPQSAPA